MRQEMIGFWDGSGISWTICTQCAPRSRRITTPTPHHSIFTGWMLLLMPNQQCQITEGTSSYTHTRLTALLSGLPGWADTRKVNPIWILLKQETVSGSGISWAICKSAPRSRQTTMPAPHHSVFTGWMPFLPPNQQRQSTEGKEIRQIRNRPRKQKQAKYHNHCSQLCNQTSIYWTKCTYATWWLTVWTAPAMRCISVMSDTLHRLRASTNTSTSGTQTTAYKWRFCPLKK